MSLSFFAGWNSVDSLGRWLTVCTYVGIFSTLLATACGYFGYKVSQRRDLIKDQLSQQQEARRLNQISLLKDANSEALARVDQLQKRSLKIGVMSIALQAVGHIHARQQGGFGTYAGHLVCTLELPEHSNLIFTAEHFEVFDTEAEQKAQALLDFAGPNISGKTIADLDGIQHVNCALSSSFGSIFTNQPRNYNIDLILNGVRLPLVQDQVTKGTTEGFESVLGNFTVPVHYRPISKRYEAIM